MPVARTAPDRLRRLLLALAVAASVSAVGAPTAWAADEQATTIDDSAVGSGPDTITYRGSWTADGRDASTGATAHRSARKGSTLTLRFIGSGVSLFGADTPHRGHVAVSVDGGRAAVVHLHRRHRGDDPIYASGALPAGPHELRLVVLGGSRATMVSFDKAVVEGTAAGTVAGPSTTSSANDPVDSSAGSSVDGSSVDGASVDSGSVGSGSVGSGSVGSGSVDSTSVDSTSADSAPVDPSAGTSEPSTAAATAVDPTATGPTSAAPVGPTVTGATSGQAAGQAAGQFVTRNGTQLLAGGRPWKFVGLNAVYMLGCSNATTAVDSIENYFTSMGPGHVDRVWVLPGTDLAQVDRVVAAAKAAGSRVYLSLADANGACGDPGGKKSADWYRGGWRASHEAHIRSVVTRYKDEPTVAFWELINESSGDAAAVRAFNDDAGALIKTIDGNHLVESGTMPSYAFGGTGGWSTANGSPSVDITSIHEYDGDEVESHWLLDALPLTRALAKPVVVGEFGIEASPSGSGCAYSYAGRAALVAQKLDAYLAHDEVAGANYWAYEGNVTGCDVGTPPSDTGLLTALKAKAAALG